MAQQRLTEVKVGAFVLICLIVVGGLILRFGKSTSLTRKTYTITVVFPNANGIVRDANVVYTGITVGKVRSISFDDAGALRVKLTLAIHEGVPIRRGSKFVINQSGL